MTGAVVAGAVVAGAVVVVVAVLSAFLLQTVKLKSTATTRSATIAHFPKLFLFILSPSLFPIYMRTLNVFFFTTLLGNLAELRHALNVQVSPIPNPLNGRIS